MEIKIADTEIKDLVQTKIHLAIAKALSEDPKVLIEAIVEKALIKKEHSYDQRTILQTEIEQMISSAAREEFKKWLDKNRSIVATAIRKRLTTEKEDIIKMVADKLVDGMASSFYVRCHFDVEKNG